jgi:aryl-alcohol dehydrogenase-like predicted oxidoreductase
MGKRNMLSRRKFIVDSAKAASVVTASSLLTSCSFISGKNAAKYKIPRRVLGKTGLEASILAFGGGSQFLQNNDGEWELLLEAAVEGGINFFETAPTYIASQFWETGDGKSLDSSEQRYGQVLSAYRDQLILSTKLPGRDVEGAKKSLESSLKNFKTDYLDIWMIHGITIDDDISEIEKGLYNTMLSFKESGVVKNIGFSCMNDPAHGRELLEKLDFDVTLVAMNATKYGGFAETILPAARKKNMGVIAMKLMRDIVGEAATPKELLEYAWTQEGVASATVGHWGIETLQENIRIAEAYGKTPVAQVDREELENRLAYLAGPHALCWARPGYRDGAVVTS